MIRGKLVVVHRQKERPSWQVCFCQSPTQLHMRTDGIRSEVRRHVRGDALKYLGVMVILGISPVACSGTSAPATGACGTSEQQLQRIHPLLRPDVLLRRERVLGARDAWSASAAVAAREGAGGAEVAGGGEGEGWVRQYYREKPHTRPF